MTSEERARELLEAEIDKPEAPWVPQLGRVNTSQALRAIVRAMEEEREAAAQRADQAIHDSDEFCPMRVEILAAIRDTPCAS